MQGAQVFEGSICDRMGSGGPVTAVGAAEDKPKFVRWSEERCCAMNGPVLLQIEDGHISHFNGHISHFMPISDASAVTSHFIDITACDR